jgi:hypothetical protein
MPRWTNPCADIKPKESPFERKADFTNPMLMFGASLTCFGKCDQVK